MHWGLQPVRLTAFRADSPPLEAPITSVHIAAFQGKHVLIIRDRKGLYGFPGGRLDPGETREQAMAREVYEEANAYLEPDYALYAVIKIEYLARLRGRSYPHDYSYMGMYSGKLKSLDPFSPDPAGIVVERSLMTYDDCEIALQKHDQILLREAVAALRAQSLARQQTADAFLVNQPEH